MTDRVQIQAAEERRSRRFVHLLVVLCFLSFVDLGFTLWAQRFTPFQELNPLGRRLLNDHSTASLILRNYLWMKIV